MRAVLSASLIVYSLEVSPIDRSVDCGHEGDRIEVLIVALSICVPSFGSPEGRRPFLVNEEYEVRNQRRYVLQSKRVLQGVKSQWIVSNSTSRTGNLSQESDPVRSFLVRQQNESGALTNDVTNTVAAALAAF